MKSTTGSPMTPMMDVKIAMQQMVDQLRAVTHAQFSVFTKDAGGESKMTPMTQMTLMTPMTPALPSSSAGPTSTMSEILCLLSE